MNVYLYGGTSRFNATESVVENNAPVELGKTYLIDHKTGFLLVAYPNEGKATDFEFTYKIEATHEDKSGQIIEDIPEDVDPLLPGIAGEWWEGEEGEQILMILCAALGLVLLLCIMACCCCKNPAKNRVEIIECNRQDLAQMTGQANVPNYNGQHGQGNDTSIELEDMDDDDEMGGHTEGQ